MTEKNNGLTCGVIMPISGSEDYPASHWVDVREIIEEAVRDAGFEPNLVSDGDGVTVIHKRIVQILYSEPIVVCDVSGKNPNVMFELGLRLAFDKPTIIVKDDVTDYSFDTASIEHIGYPRDLRFGSIVDFKNKLTKKITGTHSTASSDPAFSTFLKHFGEFKVPKIEQKEVGSDVLVLEEIKALRNTVEHLVRISRRSEKPISINPVRMFTIDVDDLDPKKQQQFFLQAAEFLGSEKIIMDPRAGKAQLRALCSDRGHRHLQGILADLRLDALPHRS